MNVAVLATPLVILALVNLGKSSGINGKASLVLSVVLGVVFAVTDGLLAANVIYQYVSNGLLLGLSAAGLYDVSVSVGSYQAKRSIEAAESN